MEPRLLKVPMRKLGIGMEMSTKTMPSRNATTGGAKMILTLLSVKNVGRTPPLRATPSI